MAAEKLDFNIDSIHMDQVPFFDLKRQHASIKDEVRPAIDAVLEATAFSGGEFSDTFENEFAEYCTVAYARGVNSGTTSLHLALLALGVKAGDEVIMPGHTFIASSWGATYIGATPVFVDSLPDTWEVDPAAVEKAITLKTRAIIAVHLYGVPADMDALKKIADAHNLPLVEDCAQAHGAFYKGKKVGSIGTVGCFSFYPSKNLGAYGDAGIITTNDKTIADRIAVLRNHGCSERYVHDVVGYNARMTGIQGAVLSVKLKHLDSWNARKSAIVQKYRTNITNPLVTLQAVTPDTSPAYHLSVITTENREKFTQHMKSQGIATALHYPIPCHLQKAYGNLGYKKGDLPNAEYIAEHCVSLPLFPELTDKEVDRIIQAVNIYV
jgi:dTDP-4-amino-4,6-dideoxygalactose transaminase